MTRAKQMNFYVNPETEKELYSYLMSIPNMVRSSWIKDTLLARLKGEPISIGNFYNINNQKEEKSVKGDNVIRYSGEELDIDFDDIV